MEEIDKSKIDKHRNVAYIVVGNSQWKIKERNFSKEYAIGKYIRWDASRKTWKKNMKRLKLLLSRNKKVKVLKLMIAEHGDEYGYYDPEEGVDIKTRFKEVVKIIKENFLDKDPNRKLYFKTSSCYGAFCMPDSPEEEERKYTDIWLEPKRTEAHIYQKLGFRGRNTNVFDILAKFFINTDDKNHNKLEEKYKNRIWFTNVMPNNSVNCIVPILGERKPLFFTIKKANAPGKWEYIKQYIKYLFSNKDAKTFANDWLKRKQKAHPEWDIHYGADRKVYFSLDDYCDYGNDYFGCSPLKSLLCTYNYTKEEENKIKWKKYIGDEAKKKKNSCIYSYACKNVNNNSNINDNVNKNDNTISH